MGGPDNWGLIKKLIGSDVGPQDRYGFAVGVSGDIVAVGSRQDDDLGINAGAALERAFGGLPKGRADCLAILSDRD